MDDDGAGEELMPGVWFKVEAPGEGSAPEYKQVVECSFTGRIQGADEVFEEVRHRRVRVGDGDVPPALELALKRMRARERALVRADSRFAYGPQGRPAKKGGTERAVPPNSDLEWTVEVHTLGTAKAAGDMSPAEQLEEAENRKELGNEHFAHAEWAKAAKSYEEAMKAVDFDSYDASSDSRAKAVQTVLDSGNNLTLALMKMEQWAKAKEACIHVLQVDGGNLKALFRASQIAMTQHNHEEAAAALKRARQLHPDCEEVCVQQKLLDKKKQAYLQKEKRMSAKMGGFMLDRRDEPPPQNAAEGDGQVAEAVRSETPPSSGGSTRRGLTGALTAAGATALIAAVAAFVARRVMARTPAETSIG